MDDNYDAVLESALALGREKHPDAPAEHHSAFANSVAELVTGWSGGYGGPYMRQHLAVQKGYAAGLINCSFEAAVEVAEKPCFGPVTLEHACMLEEEECFDDTSDDIEAARQLLALAAARGGQAH